MTIPLRIILFFWVLLSTQLIAQKITIGAAGSSEYLACGIPEFPGTFAVGLNSASCTWATDSIPLTSTFELELQETGVAFTGNAQYTNIAAPPFVINSLQAGKSYKFRVRAICGPNDVSGWSVEGRFRTNLLNPSCGLNLSLADTSCAPETNQFRMQVTQAPGSALGTNVRLRAVRFTLAHTWVGDMAISLVSPSGVRVRLVDSLQSGEDHFGDINDPNCGNYTELSPYCTTTSIRNGSAPYIGTFLPLGNFNLFNNGSNPNGVWTLEACDLRANDRGILRFAELVFEPINCMPPDAAIVQNISLNSAQVLIPAGMGCDSLTIEYGLKGFRPGIANQNGPIGTMSMASCIGGVITISGLQPFKEYSVFLRKMCSPGVYSPNSCRTDFYTDCSFPSEEENFNTQSNCPLTCGSACPLTGHWHNAIDGTDDFDWTTTNLPTPSNPTGPDSDFEGTGRYAYIETSGTSCSFGRKAVLRSDCINIIDQPGDCDLSFAYHMFGNTTGKLQVEASQDGGLTWTILWQRSGNVANAWQRQKIDLQAYDGQRILLRFVGFGGNGATGDIAIDNIRFFGATFINHGATVYYRDADGDGYGNDNIFLSTCADSGPAGYVLIAGDCNDNNASVYPGAPEVYCNGIDENCNGMADDPFLPAPLASNQAACAETPITLTASQTLGNVHWYTAQTNGTLLGTGASLSYLTPSANTTLFVKDSLPGCPGQWDTVQITSFPKPNLTLNQTVELCLGNTLNLNALPISETRNTGAILTYYGAYPFNQANTIQPPAVAPTTNRTYYLSALTAQQCSDTLAIPVNILQNPVAVINQNDTLKLCKGAQAILSCTGSGSNFLPFSYSWSNGLNFAQIPINSAASAGSSTLVLTVSDTKGCRARDSIVIQTLQSITQTDILEINDVSACGGADGSIVLQPVNGTAPYTFSWSGSQGTGTLANITGQGTIPGLAAGGWRVTVTDSSPGGGCGMTMPLMLINAPNFKVDTVLRQSVQCPGGNNGSITILVTGQNPQIAWSNNQTGHILTGLSSGTYSATVTDGACSQVIQDIQIYEPSPVDIVANAITEPRCTGEASGAIDIFVTGGTGTYQYKWSKQGIFTQDLSNAASGTYTVTITDGASCVTTAAFQIPTTPDIVVSVDSIFQPKCAGDQNGFLSVSTSGGYGPYSYLWDNGAQTRFRSNLSAGTYSLTVTDSRQCTKVFTRQITAPAVLTVQPAIVQNPTCIGVNDGAILLTGSGGTTPYRAEWLHTTSPLLSIGSLPSGIYQARITDANQCSVTLNPITLVAPQMIQVQYPVIQDIACFGQATGHIALQVSSPSPSTIRINGAIAPPSNPNLPAADYLILVQNQQGCTYRDTITLTQPLAPLYPNIATIEPPLCAQDQRGSVVIETTGGTQPYQFLWNNNQNTESLLHLGPGNYQLTVTDDKGCTATTQNIVITEPQPLITTVQKQDIPCFGISTGSIELSTSGGVQPYQFLWNTQDTTSALYFLSPNDYSVTVTDANGCTQEQKAISVLDLKQDFEVSVLKAQSLICHNQQNGQIIVSVNDQNPPYAFNWSQPIGLRMKSTTTDTLVNLLSGSYQVTVTNANGCVAVSPAIEVFNPPVFQVLPDQINPVLCKGNASGSVQLSVSGGVPPYTYAWSDQFQGSNSTRTGMAAGTYTVVVTDFNTCSLTLGPLSITEPANGIQISLDAQNGGITNDHCSACKGKIQINVMGGQPGYTYAWSNGSTEPDLQNVCAGTYTVTVTDQSGCTLSLSDLQVLALSNTPGFDTVRITDNLCHGDSAGVIATHVDGGTPPYQVFWSNDTMGDTLTQVPAGLYIATITDAVGCSSTFGVLVNEPDSAITVTGTINTPSWGQMNGSIFLNIKGGIPGYSVSWSPNAQGQTGPNITGLGTGVYQATVTDASGCMQIFTFDCTSSTDHLPEYLAGIQLSPNPASSHVNLLFSAPSANFATLHYSILDYTGRELINGSLDIANQRTCIDMLPIPAGLYMLALKDETGGRAYLRFVKGE